jgi:zinc transporter ZupT
MQLETTDLSRTVVRRIFVLQISLVVTILMLLLVSDWFDVKRFGFDFWLAFFAGCMGASISLRIRIGTDDKVLQETGRSVVDTLMPILYGAIMAGLTYLLFMSGILSGNEGEGLLTTNLFPTFDVDLVDLKTEGVVKAFLGSRPATLPDLGKLLVWCFLAGYSEKFVIGILGKLEHRSDASDAADSPARD